MFRILPVLLSLMMILGACSTPRIQGGQQVQSLTLEAGQFAQYGLALLTPSTVTGQEEDKQALALSFYEVLKEARPDFRAVSLPRTLTALNRAGMAGDYRRLLDDYRATGVFEKDQLARLGAIVGARYFVQLKLAGFRQETRERWGLLGLRVYDTRSTTVRLYMQVWDSAEGAIVWEASTELTSAYDTLSEETISFGSAIQSAARQLIERLP